MPTTQEIIFAEVVLDSAIDRPLDYAVPEHLRNIAVPGIRVSVPVRNTMRQGTICILKTTSAFPNALPIDQVLSEKPFICPELFQLADWMARYYCCSLRKVLKSILPPSIRGSVKAKEQLHIQSLLSSNALVPLTEKLRRTHTAQADILDVILQFPKGILLSELLERASCSRSPIDTLIKKKILSCQKVTLHRSPLEGCDYFPTKPKALNHEQQTALLAIQESLNQSRFETRLIYGVTGSGKTEVYLQAIEHALSLNKGVIFLVPEIALTSQTVERLRSRFEEKIALLHHRLSEGERHDAWHQLRDGKVPIVIGARSAIFSPIPNLGLVIIDEEQEGAFKQSDESPSYHARDVAVMRGKLCQATVLLGSATPSLESYTNALNGKYTLSILKERADSASLPKVQVVDMRIENDRAKGFALFSESLINGIKKRLDIGEQTILFLNRRGYHTSQMCQSCSHVIECPECDVSLTFHLKTDRLSCHLCGYSLSPPPRTCPSCKAEGHLKFKGVGTEMVERALHALFPLVRTLRLDADTTRHKGSHEELFKQFKAGKADVLIGTQMIAKGLHFPTVTLVGILNADSNLQIPDFRASEQVFQLITQVAGRSGRGAMAGEVLIQTRMPEHPVITLAARQDFEAFYHDEIAARELFHYPPYTRLIKLTFTGTSEEVTQQQTEKLRAACIHRLPPTCNILPVAPCGHAKVKGRFRFQFLIKGEKTSPILPLLHPLLQNWQTSSQCRLHIDIDPLSTFF